MVSDRKLNKVSHVGDQTLDQYFEGQFREISNCLKQRHLDNTSARSDQSEDNAILEKLLLSSFNFGLTSPRQIRKFFEDIVTWASEALLIFMTDLIELWERLKIKIQLLPNISISRYKGKCNFQESSDSRTGYPSFVKVSTP